MHPGTGGEKGEYLRPGSPVSACQKRGKLPKQSGTAKKTFVSER